MSTPTPRYPRTILGTCCIPWAPTHDFAEDTFRDGVRLLLNHGFHHLYIFGTAGEATPSRSPSSITSRRHFVKKCRPARPVP